MHGAAAPLSEGSEARDGVTPAMRDARRRLFRRPLTVNPDLVRRVEEQILTIASVRALILHCHPGRKVLPARLDAIFGPVFLSLCALL